MADQHSGAGWMYAEGDPPGTVRYWNGSEWQGGPQPVGPPSQTPDAGAEAGGWSGTRKTVVGISVAFALVGLVVWWSLAASRGQVEAGDRFLNAVMSQDFETAVATIAEECIDEEGFTAAVLESRFRGFEVVDFELQSDAVGVTNSDQTGLLVGTVEIATGETFEVRIEMIKRGDWKVCEFETVPGAGR